VILAKHPEEYPVPGEHLVVEKVPFNPNNIKLAEGEFILKNLVISLDPYARNRMKPQTGPTHNSFLFALGSSPTAHGISEVIKTNSSKFKVGDLVYGMTGWEEYTHVPANQEAEFEVYNHIKTTGRPLSNYVGVLGMPGQTAYIGMTKYAQPLKKGETLFVSAASGAVGQLVGQIGKHYGLHVVGSAGDDAKVEYLVKECGYNAAFNYKKHDTGEKLKELCPNGIDIYYENVGGKTLEHVLNNANVNARIVVCGMISQYNTTNPEPIHNLIQLIFKRIRMQGFVVMDSIAEYQERFFKDVTAWLNDGSVVYKEDVAVGIEKAPEAFVGMLQGKNFGKQVVKIF